jgi:hypothetical protein
MGKNICKDYKKKQREQQHTNAVVPVEYVFSNRCCYLPSIMTQRFLSFSMNGCMVSPLALIEIREASALYLFTISIFCLIGTFLRVHHIDFLYRRSLHG